MRHAHPKELLDLCERHGDSAYIQRTAQWIKDNYPGSAGELLPKLRTMYKTKKLDEAKAHAAKVRSVPQVSQKSHKY